MRIRIHAVFFVFFLAIVPAPFAFAFQIYHKVRMAGMPAELDGVKKMPMVFSQTLWSKGQDRQLLPSKERVMGFISGKYANYTGPLAIDVEHWPLNGSDAQVASRVEKFITLWEWVKSAAPNANVGYYSVVPHSGYAQSQVPSSHPRYIGWQEQNDRAKKLADRVDAIYPNCYPFNSDQAAWVRFCTAKLNEVKRLGNKPAIPFINTRYRPSASGGLAWETVPKEFMKLQLETIRREGAEGVVIWGMGELNKQWNGGNHPWYQAVQEVK